MTVSLDNAISGLRAAQQQLNVIANNVSNAGTEGYTRKILPQETLLLNGNGAGVKLQAIMRRVDMTLLRDLVRQVSVQNAAATKQNYLSQIQEFHGASEAERSISAYLGRLGDAFSELSTGPDNPIYLSSTVEAARQTAQTFNRYNDLLADMRNQTQKDISSAIVEINQSLNAIADLNARIGVLDSQGRSTAEYEDMRDREISNISQYMELSSYSIENKKIVLMTKRGETLVDNAAKQLSFDETPVSAGSYYPGGGINGIMIESIDITRVDLGGKLGALIEMRDEVLPTYQAQLDELAQKTAERFDAIGLRLFTDANRMVPASVAPPATPTYVGFAGEIRVNPDIVADQTLLRAGTYGQTVLPGSNEMIRKVTEYALGINLGQQATGGIDISVGTIFGATGLTQQAQMIGSVNIAGYTPDLSASPNITPPASFQLSIGVTPYVITINPGDTATDLVNTINTAVGSTVASLNGLGQLKFDATADISVADISMGAGFGELGLTAGTALAQDPSFTVQVGTQSPVTVNIGPGDTAATLLLTLNTIPGLTASLDINGYLTMAPTRGGSLAIANVVGEPIQDLGLNISYVPHATFRTGNLGPDGSIATGLVSNSSIADFSRSMVSAQSEDHAAAVTSADRETSFYQSLSARSSDANGVNIDQELSELIRVQTAYSAAARMIAASEQMMDELLNAFR